MGTRKHRQNLNTCLSIIHWDPGPHELSWSAANCLIQTFPLEQFRLHRYSTSHLPFNPHGPFVIHRHALLFPEVFWFDFIFQQRLWISPVQRDAFHPQTLLQPLSAIRRLLYICDCIYSIAQSRSIRSSHIYIYILPKLPVKTTTLWDQFTTTPLTRRDKEKRFLYASSYG